jgi:hypothetical protein
MNDIARGQKQCAAAETILKARLLDYEAALIGGNLDILELRRDACFSALESVLDNKAYLVKKLVDGLGRG